MHVVLCRRVHGYTQPHSDDLGRTQDHLLLGLRGCVYPGRLGMRLRVLEWLLFHGH
jgi:hypothetical protein